MKTNSIVGKKCYGLILKGKETINIDTKEQLNYLRVIYKKKVMKLLCPSPELFSEKIKKI